MKNIAVLVFDLTVEYNIVVVDGICDYLCTKDDVHVITSTVNTPHNQEFQYDYQYWTAFDILKSDNIDAAIIVPNSFCNTITMEELASAIKSFSPKPIISVACPLKVKNNYYTCVSCEDAYDEIVEHLLTKHNRKKIGFLNAALSHSPDSQERENAYRKAMKKYGLEVNEDWILYGDFTPKTAYDCVKNLYKSREEIPFDALLCANDYMASGVEKYFNEIGVNIPEDVCIFGFDDSQAAVNSSPLLSTISQGVAKTGYEAAVLAYDLISGKEIPKSVTIQAFPLYRQSCGCMDKSLGYVGYYDKTGTYHEREKRLNDSYLFGNSSMSDLATIYHILNMADSATHMNDFFKIALKNLDAVRNIRMLAICVYDKSIELTVGQTFKKPDKAKLLMYIDKDKGIENNYYNQGGIEFDINKQILPNNLEDLSSGHFLLLPMFLQKLNYGYLICKLPDHRYPIFTIFLKLLTNSFIHSYMYSKNEAEFAQLAAKNQTLDVQSKTDELTKLFNRRGFMEFGQQLLDITTVSNSTGCVFFCDLDGLKTINDTWGHEIGDLAIKTEAKVLRAAFRDSDLIGRLSGDEFGVVAPRFPLRKLDDLRNRLCSLNEEYSKEAKLPCTLSISIGAVELDENVSELKELLKLADKNLYIEKKEKHKKR